MPVTIKYIGTSERTTAIDFRSVASLRVLEKRMSEYRVKQIFFFFRECLI